MKNKTLILLMSLLSTTALAAAPSPDCKLDEPIMINAESPLRISRDGAGLITLGNFQLDIKDETDRGLKVKSKTLNTSKLREIQQSKISKIQLFEIVDAREVIPCVPENSSCNPEFGDSIQKLTRAVGVKINDFENGKDFGACHYYSGTSGFEFKNGDQKNESGSHYWGFVHLYSTWGTISKNMAWVTIKDKSITSIELSTPIDEVQKRVCVRKATLLPDKNYGYCAIWW